MNTECGELSNLVSNLSNDVSLCYDNASISELKSISSSPTGKGRAIPGIHLANSYVSMHNFGAALRGGGVGGSWLCEK